MAVVTTVKLPTTASGAGWTTPENALAQDAQEATFRAIGVGNPLALSAFGFVLGTGTVVGISVRVRCRYSSRTCSVRVGLAQAGAATVTKPDQTMPGSLGDLTFGGPTDLWGRSWTPADVNDASFTVQVTPIGSAGGGYAHIDVVEVTVYLDSYLVISYEFGMTPDAIVEAQPVAPISIDFSTSPFDLTDNRGFTRFAQGGGILPSLNNGLLECPIPTFGATQPSDGVNTQMTDLDPTGGEIRTTMTLPAGSAGNGCIVVLNVILQKAAAYAEGGQRQVTWTFRKNSAGGARVLFPTENLDGTPVNLTVLTDPPGLGDTVTVRIRELGGRFEYAYSLDGGAQWVIHAYSILNWPTPKVKPAGIVQLYGIAQAAGFPVSQQSVFHDNFYWSGLGRQWWPVYLGRIIGAARFSATQYVTPSGIGPTGTVGAPVVTIGLKAFPTGIGPSSAVGTPTVVQQGVIRPFGIGPGTNYPAAVRADRPVAYWRLEEPAGVFADEVGSNNATASTPANLQRGIQGMAPSDPNGKAVNVTDVCALTAGPNRYTGLPRTIEALVLPTAFPVASGGPAQMVIYSSANFLLRLDWIVGAAPDGPRFIFWVRKADGTFANAWSGTIPVLNRRYHVCGVSTPGTTRIYVDGQLVGSSSSTPNDGTSYPDTTAVALSSSGINTWKGVLDEVAIYDVALSQAQVQAHVAAITIPDKVGTPMLPRFVRPTGIGPGSTLGVPTLIRQPAALPPAPRAEILWRLILCDANGVPIEDLSPFAFDRKLSYRLNRPETLSFRVPADARLVNKLAPDGRPNLATIRRTVKAYRAERQPDGTEVYVLRFVGVIWQIADVGDYDNAWTTVVAFGLMQRLARRLSVSSSGAETGVVYTNVDGGLIVHTMLSKINLTSFTGIDQGTREPTTARTADFTFLDVASAVSQLANAYQGFDINLVPLDRRDGHLARLDIVAQRGTYRPNAIFAWGLPPHNVSATERLMDAEVFANSVALLGATPEQDGALPIIANATDNASVTEVKQYRIIDSYPDVVNASYLTALANEELTYRRRTREIITLTPQPGRAPEPFTDYDLGDTIPLYVGARLRGGFQGVLRVYGFDIDVSNEGAERVSALQLSPE